MTEKCDSCKNNERFILCVKTEILTTESIQKPIFNYAYICKECHRKIIAKNPYWAQDFIFYEMKTMREVEKIATENLLTDSYKRKLIEYAERKEHDFFKFITIVPPQSSNIESFFMMNILRPSRK